MLVACFHLTEAPELQCGGLTLCMCVTKQPYHTVYNLCPYVNHLYAHTLLCYFIAHVRLTIIHLLYIL